MTQTVPSVAHVQATLVQLKDNIRSVIKGKDEVIDQVLVCLVASGHLLIEDLPGMGKTTLAYCLAQSIDCGFTRLQFTSDLLPSDVIGVSVYDEYEKAFVFKPGPIFTNILLADEINRTTPKTQSALLEVMDRGKVSVDGKTYAADTPFMVFATQNPVDYEGTFPLPESQMDRFLMRIRMGYPDRDNELEILQAGLTKYDDLDLPAVASRQEILAIQRMAPAVFVEDSVLRYLLQIVTATREEPEFRAGVSTRGGLSLKLAAQAAALTQGRDFVIPDDAAAVLMPVLTHRLSLRRQTADPLEERRIVQELLQRILDRMPPPV
jgi:MoxR-like ATPase